MNSKSCVFGFQLLISHFSRCDPEARESSAETRAEMSAALGGTLSESRRDQSHAELNGAEPTKPIFYRTKNITKPKI